MFFDQESVDEALHELQRIFGRETVRVGDFHGQENRGFVLEFTIDVSKSAEPAKQYMVPYVVYQYLAVEIGTKCKVYYPNGIEMDPAFNSGFAEITTEPRNAFMSVLMDPLIEPEGIKSLKKRTPLSFPSIQYLDIPTRDFYERHSKNLKLLRAVTEENWRFHRNKEDEDNGLYVLILPQEANIERVINSMRMLGKSGEETNVMIRKTKNGNQKLCITADWFEKSEHLKDIHDRALFQKIIREP